MSWFTAIIISKNTFFLVFIFASTRFSYHYNFIKWIEQVQAGKIANVLQGMNACVCMNAKQFKRPYHKGLHKKKSPKYLVLPTFIVSLLLNLSSSQVSLLPLSLYYQVIRYQSSTVAHQSTDSEKGGLSVSSCLLRPALWQPLRGSWDTAWRGDLALTLHREILSFGALLLRYQLMPCKCPDKTLDAFCPIPRRREKSSSHVFVWIKTLLCRQLEIITDKYKNSYLCASFTTLEMQKIRLESDEKHPGDA